MRRMESMGLDRNVLKEDYFELASGESLKSLSELVEALGKMSEDTFVQHVSKFHNDFGDWVLEAYGKERLSKKIGKIRRKRKMAGILRKALKKDRVEMNDVQKIVVPKKKKEILRRLGEMQNDM